MATRTPAYLTERATMLMRLAAPLIRAHAPTAEIPYDGTVCDGYCLADDLESTADGLEGK